LPDVAQDLDGAERRQGLVAIDGKVDLVVELVEDRGEVLQILAMRLHAGPDLVDEIADALEARHLNRTLDQKQPETYDGRFGHVRPPLTCQTWPVT
jgi:hypothetical protein